MKSITTLILLILISCKCSTNKINKDIGEEKRTQLFMDTNIVGIDSSFWSSATDSIIEFNHAPDTPYNPKQILYDSCMMHYKIDSSLLYDSCMGHGDVGDIKFQKPFQVTITSTGTLSLSYDLMQAAVPINGFLSNEDYLKIINGQRGFAPKQFDTVYASDSTLIIKIFVNKVTFDTLVYKINRFQIRSK